MKKLHIALSTHSIEASVRDYSQRLGSEPSVVIQGQYALWRTDTLNLSIRQAASGPPGELRHLGWEDPQAPAFTQDVDVNGITWERFTARQQAEEIRQLWPEANHCP
ncbi:conserved hypothetical protein [Cyanobium sp. PCC 7001]|uniref:hypothetical protein n=1 Tax=Cyanobium sp. PCC 7001 TaxID=180281 RepID=UPI000180559D|nr:hypothetical protein [Cyanobium sp. PCC 7001]EDY38249.1 conserved hypothetical protein [Cyanobium sp. PCC 7001]